MTDSFMHCLKKIKLSIFFSFWMILFFSSSTIASDNSLIIKTAEINSQFEAYFLNADFDLSFNDDLDEAIKKGIPINFIIEFELKKPRKYWFDEEVTKKTKELLLTYHALSKQMRSQSCKLTVFLLQSDMIQRQLCLKNKFWSQVPCVICFHLKMMLTP